MNIRSLLIVSAFLVIILTPRLLHGQVTITSWVHPPLITYYAIGTGTCIPLPTDAGITADDGWSDVKSIGFNFTFYGNTYDQCIIASNGCLGFDLTYATAYNSWPISSSLLTDAGNGEDIHNLVAGPWTEIFIPAGGTINYFMNGVAPYRQFVVEFCGDAMFECTTKHITTYIIIYETTNIVEVQMAHTQVCAEWNGGYAEVGVKNATGTAATVAPGRDFPDTFSVTNEAWRFTPAGSSSYTVSSIPFSANFYSLSWIDSATGTVVGTGDSLVVNQFPTHVYKPILYQCSDSAGMDTLVIPTLVPDLTIEGANLSVYPNPATNLLNISSGQVITEVEVIDAVGRFVYHGKYHSGKVTLDVAAWSPGCYFLKVNNRTTAKFVKL